MQLDSTSGNSSILMSGDFNINDIMINKGTSLEEDTVREVREVIKDLGNCEFDNEPVDKALNLELKGERKHKGLRYNNDKLRYDLVHPYAIEQLVKVFSMGARKYAERNWENGMSWMSVIASLKRHLAAIERGEDYDQESGLLHSAHVEWNAHVLSAYYKIYPQGDDRPHSYLQMPKIGLDIDEVICDFTGGWAKIYGVEDKPTCWSYHREMGTLFQQMKQEGILEDFYANLKPKVRAEDLPFEPHAYVTSRPVDSCITEKWLEEHKFPGTKVITVGLGQSKVEAIRNAGIEVFVDDGYHNFVELNKAGICTYLLTAPHNARYEVGHKRVSSLKELYERFK